MKNDPKAPLLRAKEGTCSLTDVSSVTRARVRPVPPVARDCVECVQGEEEARVLIKRTQKQVRVFQRSEWVVRAVEHAKSEGQACALEERGCGG